MAISMRPNVTQEDRDIAAESAWLHGRKNVVVSRYRAGENDGTVEVRAFASHREAAFRDGAEAMQRALADALRDHLNSRAAAIANSTPLPEYQA